MLRIRDCGVHNNCTQNEVCNYGSRTKCVFSAKWRLVRPGKKIKNVPVSKFPGPYFDLFSGVLNNYKNRFSCAMIGWYFIKGSQSEPLRRVRII